jgi:hypothetical protein
MVDKEVDGIRAIVFFRPQKDNSSPCKSKNISRQGYLLRLFAWVCLVYLCTARRLREAVLDLAAVDATKQPLAMP